MLTVESTYVWYVHRYTLRSRHHNRVHLSQKVWHFHFTPTQKRCKIEIAATNLSPTASRCTSYTCNFQYAAVKAPSSAPTHRYSKTYHYFGEFHTICRFFSIFSLHIVFVANLRSVTTKIVDSEKNYSCMQLPFNAFRGPYEAHSLFVNHAKCQREFGHRPAEANNRNGSWDSFLSWISINRCWWKASAENFWGLEA